MPPFAKLEPQATLGLMPDPSIPAPPAPEPYRQHAEFEREHYSDRDRIPPTDCAGMLEVVEKTDRIWFLVCDRCEFEVGVHVGRFDPRQLAEDRVRKSGIPKGYAGLPFDDRQREQQAVLLACKRWLRAFDRRNLGESVPAIALWGDTGRGKTHLLAMMVETLIRRGEVDAIYRSAVGLFDELQAGMESTAYEVRWSRVLNVPVLALDDLGAGRMTDWRLDRLAALIDYRAAHRLPLLLSTNVPPDNWVEAFDHRSASRLRGMVQVHRLEGQDRREQQAIF